MKFEKIIAVIVTIAICLGVISFFIGMLLTTNENEDAKITMPTIYEVSAIVEEVNNNDGLVLLVDWNGEAWYYEMESEAFECGQLVIVEFDSKGTENIYDDEIVKIRGN